jgi:transposase
MLALRDEVKIYLAIEATDMRKSIDGLLAVILTEFNDKPQTGNLYLFHNKSGDKVKCIFWDRNGYVIYYKRLETGKFKIKPRTDKRAVLNHAQLSWLLAGLDFDLMAQYSELNYENYY